MLEHFVQRRPTDLRGLRDRRLSGSRFVRRPGELCDLRCGFGGGSPGVGAARAEERDVGEQVVFLGHEFIVKYLTNGVKVRKVLDMENTGHHIASLNFHPTWFDSGLLVAGIGPCETTRSVADAAFRAGYDVKLIDGYYFAYTRKEVS